MDTIKHVLPCLMSPKAEGMPELMPLLGSSETLKHYHGRTSEKTRSQGVDPHWV